MLLTSRSPLTHLDRVQSTPSHDLSILASSPIEVVEPHSPPSDGDSSVPLVPASTPTQAKSLYDRYRPVHPSPLRFVTNALERPPPVLQRRLSIANLEAPGSGVICFSRTHQRNLSTPMNVKFKGPGIVVPPVSTNRPILAPSSIASDENAFLICSDYTRLSPAADEFPDSPSIYSPTPPNSSAPLAIDLTESSTGWPNLADADLAAIDVGHHHPFGEQLPGEEPSENQASGEWPCGEDGSTAVSKEISRDARDGHALNRRRGNPADAQSWWSRVSIAAGSVTLSLVKVWESKAHGTGAKDPESDETKKIGNHEVENWAKLG